MTEPNQAHASPHKALCGCLVRLCWMLIGNAALFVSIVFIARNRAGFLSPADAAFWAVAGLLVVLRYADVRTLDGRTATGKPATMADWRRYVLILAGVCLGAWGLAHALAQLTR